MLLEIRQASVDRRLFPFSAAVERGQLIHLVGPNGAGKSSLLASLAGLLNAQGDILLNGEPLAEWAGPRLARHRAFLPQQQSPSAQMPVWHYLMMHEVQQASATEPLLMHFTDALQISDKLQRPLGQLSGGEWQRVRLAAVFLQVSQPEGQLLLLDEPMTGLDIGQQAVFDRLIPELLNRGVTVIMSSHDLNHTLRHADCVWLMRPGQPALQGKPEQILTPEHLSALYQVSFRQLQVEGRPFLTTFA
ncbi:vitamin B12 ABC transporter ATP-binding protein BtuD [Erwinia sp. JUb26]|uniref:vitamin B12 ABC transporter ATP-binding protein BtuD n=1 Tax=Erwinia sp. JUb26 TaxID=2485126 RepID=UPI000F484A2F|nr:vitamin B12 ABC transporter ATP-binding protein BtuD [Erwinia sp. JUb26]ROR15382.1 vitamin B12 transport system ATP-binding protein [Erwinia sp. JUb26]